MLEAGNTYTLVVSDGDDLDAVLPASVVHSLEVRDPAAPSAQGGLPLRWAPATHWKTRPRRCAARTRVTYAGVAMHCCGYSHGSVKRLQPALCAGLAACLLGSAMGKPLLWQPCQRATPLSDLRVQELDKVAQRAMPHNVRPASVKTRRGRRGWRAARIRCALNAAALLASTACSLPAWGAAAAFAPGSQQCRRPAC